MEQANFIQELRELEQVLCSFREGMPEVGVRGFNITKLKTPEQSIIQFGGVDKLLEYVNQINTLQYLAMDVGDICAFDGLSSQYRQEMDFLTKDLVHYASESHYEH